MAGQGSRRGRHPAQGATSTTWHMATPAAWPWLGLGLQDLVGCGLRVPGASRWDQADGAVQHPGLGPVLGPLPCSSTGWDLPPTLWSGVWAVGPVGAWSGQGRSRSLPGTGSSRSGRGVGGGSSPSLGKEGDVKAGAGPPRLGLETRGRWADLESCPRTLAGCPHCTVPRLSLIPQPQDGALAYPVALVLPAQSPAGPGLGAGAGPIPAKGIPQ